MSELADRRADFPILRQTVNGRPLVYLDNAATSQKPQAVIDALARHYQTDNANIHRGVHTLSARASAAHDAARDKLRGFINAADTREIVFVRGATEAINLVAASWGGANLRPGDEVLITGLEHHANIVPWQLACARGGARLLAAPLDGHGAVRLDEYARLLGPRTRMVALAHVSNALGTINPLAEMIPLAKARGAAVLIDGAQAVPHCPVDVQALGCDFYAFSGHKMYAPTGIGVLWGRRELLDAMPPWQGGGDMIRSVTLEASTWNDLPYKFEAGTPDIGGAVALGAAVDYLNRIGMDRVAAHERALLAYATERALTVPGLRIVGTAAEKAGILSFVLDGIHPHDIGSVLDHEGVAVRAGHHCAMPVMAHFGVPATARASFALYNHRADVDALIAAIHQARKLFGHD